MKRLLQAIALGFLGLVGLSVLMGSGVVPGAYNTIENNGTPLTKRSILNFPNSGCVDNSGNASTDCTFLTASTVPGNYTQSFTSQTSVILTHNLNTTAVIVQCYDAASPPAMIIPNTTKITDANDVTVTFLVSQSGKCQVSGSNASGGGGGGVGLRATNYVEGVQATTSTTPVSFSPTADTVTFSLSSTTTVSVMYNAISYTASGAGGTACANSVTIDGTPYTPPAGFAFFVQPGSTAMANPLAYSVSLASGSHTIEIQHYIAFGATSCQWWTRGLNVF